jgi:hypothetical protein
MSRLSLHQTRRGVHAPLHLRSISYGRSSILELKGKTQIAVVPGITIDWDEVLAKISE